MSGKFLVINNPQPADVIVVLTGETNQRPEGVEPAGQGRWTLHGSLTLHGQTRPVTVHVQSMSVMAIFRQPI